MKLEKIIVVLGPPGSGKGTQSKLLVDRLGYIFFSMGDTLRQYAKKDNALGREIKSYIDKGLIVPDEAAKEVALASWTEFLEKPGMVAEGYPRTPVQTQVFEEFMRQNNIVDLKVLSIQVDKEKLMRRLSIRKTCPNCQASYKPAQPEYDTEVCSVCGSKIAVRVDDMNTQYVEKRFSEYETKTAKIIEYYKEKGLVIEINGDQSVEAVHQEIMQKLGISKE